MDPYYEQRLREEVIYLHSLFRQGPPIPNPNPYHQQFHPYHHHHHHHTPPPLQPNFYTNFKKQRNPISTQIKKNFSDIEWPIKPPPESPAINSSGWPELKPIKNPPTRLPTPEEQARIAWNRVQQKALQASREFLSGDETDGEEDEDEDEDDDDDGMEEEGCDEEYKFFSNLFEGELKGYYEKKCCGGGEFVCLVCGGAGEKLLKRYQDCVALIQHSVSIAKTKRKRAHRAYGQAVCKVLGWEIDKLPSIASNIKSRDSLENPGDGDKEPTNEGELVKTVDGEAVSKGNSNECENFNLARKDPDVSNPVDAESMVCEGNPGDGDEETTNEGELVKTVDGEADSKGNSNECESLNLAHKDPDVSNPVDAESMVCEGHPNGDAIGSTINKASDVVQVNNVDAETN